MHMPVGRYMHVHMRMHMSTYIYMHIMAPERVVVLYL